MYCLNWVSEVADTNSILALLANPNLNEARVWNLVFSWTELALPGLPSHPYHGSVEEVQGKLHRFSLRLNIIGRLVVRAFGETEAGQLALEFLCLAEMFGNLLSRDYQVWAEQVRKGEVEGALETDLIGKAVVSLLGARSAIYIQL